MTTRIIHDAQLVDELCTLFDGAREQITILQYAFELNPPLSHRMRRIAEAILNAAARGVHVRILLNTKRGVKPNSIQAATLALYLTHPNITLYYHRPTQVMHAKAILVDLDSLIIGSHNLTRTSVYSSLNLSVIIVDAVLARAVRQLVFPIFQAAKNG